MPTCPSQPSLICDFCPSDQRFAYSFFQIPSRDGHPCCSAIHFPLSGRVRDFHPLERAMARKLKKRARFLHRESRLSASSMRPARRLPCIQISLHLFLFPSRIWDSIAGTSALLYLHIPWFSFFCYRTDIGSILISVFLISDTNLIPLHIIKGLHF